jgi:hypothetical protein
MQKQMCKQGVVQSLLLKQTPSHLVQVKNQLKQVVLEAVDLQINSSNHLKRKKRAYHRYALFLCPL